MTPPLLSAVVSSQSEREREESQAAASSSQWPGPASGPGWPDACALEARRAVEASSAVRSSGQPGEREWPVSVPGGQSWCDHSVRH